MPQCVVNRVVVSRVSEPPATAGRDANLQPTSRSRPRVPLRGRRGPVPAEAYDVAIVGGGINGTGVARDLALRGLKVVLFERNDLAFGASGNSSGMIHGGVRYLASNP